MSLRHLQPSSRRVAAALLCASFAFEAALARSAAAEEPVKAPSTPPSASPSAAPSASPSAAPSASPAETMKTAPAPPVPLPAVCTKPIPPSTSAPVRFALPPKAEAEYQAGRILFDNGDYEGALPKFLLALELSQEPRVMLKIMSTEIKRLHYTKALGWLTRFLDDPSPVIPPEDRKDGCDVARGIPQFIGAIRVVTAQAGATVTIDGVEVGTTPLAEVQRVDAGRTLEIQIKKAKFRPRTFKLGVPAGKEIVLSADLEREAHEGRLTVEAGATDQIWLDGKSVGLGRFEGAVVSGGHTLRVTAPGKQPNEREIVLKDDERRTVQVKLVDAAPGGPPAWVWIVGGAVLAGGAALGGALLFEQSPVRGNIEPRVVQLSFGGKQ